MDITTGFKPILEPAGGFQKIAYNNTSSLDGYELFYTYANKTQTATPYGNLFKSFNFPITNEEKNYYFTTYQYNALRHLNA